VSGSRVNSTKLSYLLRHGAIEAGLIMDAAGWSAIADVLPLVQMRESELDEAIAFNTKGRLQRRGAYVRACQGHSLAGSPVTLEALEASWLVDDEPGDLWHGTTREAATSIYTTGIHSGQRTHVHLARSHDAKVGKRSNVEVLLRVSRERLCDAGLTVWQAPNDVLLVRFVPAQCLVVSDGNQF
jgi:putative RNA 2'-phosphotransferase